MTNAIIGYENGLDAGTVTASSDPSAAPKENGFNWRLDNYWQPAAATSNWLEVDFGSARSVDYIGFYSSDFYSMTGAELNLFSGASASPTTSRVQENITTDSPKLFTFAAASARYWRIRLDTTGSETPKIQMVTIGTRLELQRGARPGMRPPALGNADMPYNSISASGFFLGRSVRRQPVDFRLSTDTLTPAWVRSNWPDFLAHAERYPFFVLPEPDSYTDEAVFAWTRGKINAPEYSSSTLLSMTLDLQAFI